MSKATDIKQTLQELEANIARINDPAAKAVLTVLFNLIEDVVAENEQLKQEKQRLEDELNRLKGEQGKPEFKGKKDNDISSEKERKEAEGDDGEKNKKSKRVRRPKLPDIKIDREEICPLDLAGLPEDVVFNGYEPVVVQDIKIITDNVRYLREVYYSPSQRKTWRGPLPAEVDGEYGSGVRSLIPILKSECGMSEPKLLGFLENFGIRVSAAYISDLWTGRQGVFHQEKDDIYQAGLASGTYHQIDDTKATVNGVNHHVQIVCDENFTAYFTTERKDRLTILDVFRNFAPRQFIYNEEALDLLKHFSLSGKIISAVDSRLEKDVFFDESTLNGELDEIIKLGPRQRSRILEACAISAYHQQTDLPQITTLLSDDAPQFKLLVGDQGLCWVHDGRHYKKLKPIIPEHQEDLREFLDRYWGYYGKLFRYKQNPAPEEARRLEQEFDRLFSTVTGYEQLDERIAKTMAKKTELLMVLRHPELPLHNNAAELGARVQARYRDVSLHTRSKEGTKVKDTFMTITQTAKKLGVNIYDYIYDRVSGNYQLPSLADLIRQKAIKQNTPPLPSEA